MRVFRRLARTLRGAGTEGPKVELRRLYAVAREAVRAQDAAKALPLLDEVLALEPDHGGALQSKLLMLEHTGDLDTAESLAKEWEAAPTANRWKAVARYRLARQQPTAALEILDVIDEPDARLHAWRGRAFFLLGRYGDAKEAIDAALSLDPELDLAHRIEGEIDSERLSTQRLLIPLRLSGAGGAPVRSRVLHMVTSSLPYTVTGYTVRSQSIGRAQIEIGLEPHFVTKAGFPEYEEASDLDIVDSVPYHRLAPGIGKTPEHRRIEMYAELASEVVEEVRPSVLHPATGFPNAIAALSMREAYDIPVVYEVRGFLEDSWVATHEGASVESDRYRWRRSAEIECVRSADAVVTLSETMRAEISSWGIASDKVVVVPNAIHTERFHPRPRNEMLAQRLGIRGDAVVVGYVSTLNAYEGIDVMIEAIALLADEDRRVTGLVVGDGPERVALESLVDRLNLGGRVTFTGAVPHDAVQDYYNLIDIFVVPRTSERVGDLVTPLKPLEAMAMGIPVVASRTSALREIVVDGQTGLSFAVEDESALANRIQYLLDHPETRIEIGSAGREWVSTHRSWSGVAILYEGIYDSLRG